MYFNFNEIRIAPSNQTGIVFKFLRIPFFDKRQSIDCPLTLRKIEIENNLLSINSLISSIDQFTFSASASRLLMNRGQKSRNNGLSIFFKLSLVLASTLTYNCVTGTRFLEWE